MTIIPKCFECKHFQGRREGGPGYRCAAFDAIPTEILVIEHDHARPYPGDRGIRFEPKEKG